MEQVVGIKKERDSNFELCRLVCMLYIVIYHLIIHVPAVYESTFWGRPLRTLCHIGVVVFVMISGYFGIKRKWKRLLSLALSVSFYNALGILIATLFLNQQFEIKSLLSIVFPISQGGYWFITSYAVLYMVAPYINIVLEKLENRDFLILLMVLAVVVWYGGGIWGNAIGHGRGIMAFVFSYSIGYYIRKFYSREGQPFIYWGGQYLGVSAIIFACVAFLPGILSKGINYLCFGYNEIGLYIMSVLFLLMFQSIKIKSKIINWSATSVLGIYLLHENKKIGSLVIYPIYENVFSNIGNQWMCLVAHILFAMQVLVCCIFIDKIRRIIFQKIKIE